MNEIGFRVYDFAYVEQLLEVKTAELGVTIPWFLLKGRVVPVARRFYDAGTFLAEVLDEQNMGVCQHYFIQGNDVRIPLKIKKGAVKLEAERAETTELRICAPSRVRDLFKIDAEMSGISWDAQVEQFVTRCVDRLYQDRLYFMTVDPESAKVLYELHKEEGDVDFPIRLSMPKNAA